MAVNGLKMAVLPQVNNGAVTTPSQNYCQVIDLTDDDVTAVPAPVAPLRRGAMRTVRAEKVFRCAYCQKGFKEEYPFKKHKKACSLRPVPLFKKLSMRKSLVGIEYPKIYKPKRKRDWCEKPVHPDDQERAPILDFIKSLGLSAKSQNDDSNDEKKSPEIVVLELDDSSDEESVPKITPSTPRSAKRLLSQLNRDFSPPGSRSTSTRLEDRFSLHSNDSKKVSEKVGNSKNYDKVVEGEGNILGKLVMDDGVNDEEDSLKDSDRDSDSESECSSKEEEDEKVKVRNHGNLLTIDFSSYLGQRIKDTIHYKRPRLNPSSDSEDESANFSHYEKYCKTAKKVKPMDRLRNRDNNDSVNITFIKRKRIPDHLSHYYKFSKADRKEFLKVLKTGLTARSRQLKRLVRPCKLKLRQVTQAEIKKWSQPTKPKHIYGIHNGRGGPFMLSDSSIPIRRPYRNAQIQQRMLIQQAKQLQEHQNRTGLVAPQMFLQPGFNNTGGTVVPMQLFHGSNALPTNNGKGLMRNKGVPKADTICISSDEEDDDDDVKVTNIYQAPDPRPQRPGPKSSKQPRPASQPGVIRFKCHLCSAEINGRLGATDFIAEHFKRLHDVHNIRLHETTDSRGNTVVTIVQDMPPSSAGANTPKPRSQHKSAPPTQNKSVTEVVDDDDIICLD